MSKRSTDLEKIILLMSVAGHPLSGEQIELLGGYLESKENEDKDSRRKRDYN